MIDPVPATQDPFRVAEAMLPYVACLATNLQSQAVRSSGDPVLVARPGCK